MYRNCNLFSVIQKSLIVRLIESCKNYQQQVVFSILFGVENVEPVDLFVSFKVLRRLNFYRSLQQFFNEMIYRAVIVYTEILEILKIISQVCLAITLVPPNLLLQFGSF